MKSSGALSVIAVLGAVAALLFGGRALLGVTVVGSAAVLGGLWISAARRWLEVPTRIMRTALRQHRHQRAAEVLVRTPVIHSLQRRVIAVLGNETAETYLRGVDIGDTDEHERTCAILGALGDDNDNNAYVLDHLSRQPHTTAATLRYLYAYETLNQAGTLSNATTTRFANQWVRFSENRLAPLESGGWCQWWRKHTALWTVLAEIDAQQPLSHFAQHLFYVAGAAPIQQETYLKLLRTSGESTHLNNTVDAICSRGVDV